MAIAKIEEKTTALVTQVAPNSRESWERFLVSTKEMHCP